MQIITLTNTLPFANTIPFTDEIDYQYYRYRAGSNVTELNIELLPLDGDVNMVEKHDLPLPTVALFDQRSDNPGLTPDVLLVTNVPPATILPGSYYMGVFNAEPNRTDVTYAITVQIFGFSSIKRKSVIRIWHPISIYIGNGIISNAVSVGIG